MMIFDAHLDLAMNAMEWNRDLRWSLDAINQSEDNLTDKPGRGEAMVSFDAMRAAGIGICVATLISRYVKPQNPLPGWNSPEQAWAHAQGQLAWYRSMERVGQLTPIVDQKSLQKVLKNWKKADGDVLPIGYILSLEGADSIVDMDHLEVLHSQGLRALGPAHYGPGTYAFGTDSDGGIGENGAELIRKMADLNIILDVTHLCDTSFWEVMEVSEGPVWSSHSNCRQIVPHHRQFDDEQIQEIIRRSGVIGVVMDAWMIVDKWEKGLSTYLNTSVTLDHLVDHIIHICTLAGNTDQVGVGSDLDGGFGRRQCPEEINSIEDLPALGQAMARRDFSNDEIRKILSSNWLNFLERIWI